MRGQPRAGICPALPPGVTSAHPTRGSFLFSSSPPRILSPNPGPESLRDPQGLLCVSINLWMLIVPPVFKVLTT